MIKRVPSRVRYRRQQVLVPPVDTIREIKPSGIQDSTGGYYPARTATVYLSLYNLGPGIRVYKLPRTIIPIWEARPGKLQINSVIPLIARHSAS